MALTVTSVGTGLDGVGGTTSGATVTATVANNDWLVVVQALSADDVVTVSDSAGNVYTQRGAADTAPSGTINAHLRIFTAPVTSNITNGTVTASYTAAAGAMQVYRVRPSSGTITFVTADTVGVSGAATNHAAATVSVANGNVIFGAAAIETNDAITGDSDTLNGSWSTVATVLDDHGSDTTSQSLVTQFKVVTGTGNQSWACATTSSRQSARSYLVLHGPAAAFSLAAALGQYSLSGKTVTLRKSMAPLVAGVGSYALTGTAATPEHGWLVAAVAGSYGLTGTDAGLLHGWRLDASTSGSYALTGTDAAPLKTAAGGKAISAMPGTYVLTGTDANLLHGWLLAAAAGSYALAGTDAPVLHGWRLTAETSSVWDPGGSDTEVTFSNGNTVAAQNTSGFYFQSRNTTARGGKRIWSLIVNYISHVGMGVVDLAGATTSVDDTAHWTGWDTHSVALYTDGWWYGGASLLNPAFGTPVTGDIYDFAIDFDAKKIWVRRNGGNWNNSGAADPVAGTGAASPAGIGSTGYIALTTAAAGDGATIVTVPSFSLSGFLPWDSSSSGYFLTGANVALNAAVGNKAVLADVGTYLLTGTNATLAAGKMVAVDPGTYLLTGTAATLTASVPAAPPIRAIGEPPIARERRRRIEAERARALEQQRKARDRLKRAIGRLLEGLPPEFDEPEQLAEAEDNAVQAFNLLWAMRAPAPELDAVAELIDTIQAIRIAQPIVQLELARAYNHSHRHLMQKAQEDVVMTLLLGE